MSITLQELTKRYGDQVPVDHVSLEVQTGELFVLLGASGSGKSTILRMIAGHEDPTAGEIVIGGENVVGLAPVERRTAMMFQSYALFPHLSVFDNLAYGLRREGVPRPEIARRVAEALSMVGLQGMERRLPHQLSGGQRQRVALAEAGEGRGGEQAKQQQRRQRLPHSGQACHYVDRAGNRPCGRTARIAAMAM